MKFQRNYLVFAVFGLLQFGSIAAAHKYPQTVFYNEFFSAGVVAVLTMFATLTGVCNVLLPRWLLIFPCAAGLAIAGGSGMTNMAPLATYSFLYLLTYVCVHVWCGQVSRERIAESCAWGVLVCASLHCIVSLLQLNGVSAQGWVMVKLMNAAYGNIAQENHFANLVWLGITSGLYLWLRRALSTPAALIFLFVFVIFAALSVSRAVWLYTVAVPIVIALYARKVEVGERLRVMRGAASIFTASVLSQLWLAYGGAQAALGVTSAIDRVSEGGSNGQRLFDWIIAWKTALAHPFTGVGPGMYSWQTALGSVGLPPVNYVRIGENAHNTLLHFMAEFGLVFGVLMLALIGTWLWRRWKEVPTLESLWGLGIVAVIGAHSLVEYPLWYAYFLVPLGCAIGVIDAGDEGLPALRFDARWLLVPSIAGALLLASTWHDYRRLEAAYKRLDAAAVDARTAAELDSVGASIRETSLLAPQAAILRMRAWHKDDLKLLPEIVAVCDRSLKIKPQYNSFTACMTAYTLSGRKEEADQINEIVCGAYAPVHSRPFIQYAQQLYAQRKWVMPTLARCAG